MPYPSNDQDAEAMMDEIASAQSAAELVWLRAEVARRFTSDLRRAGLERLIDEMMLVMPSRGAAPRPTG